MEIKYTLFVIFLCIATSLAWDPHKPQPGDANWMKKHKLFLNETKELNDDIKVVFIGASIMEFWQTEGKPVWKYYLNKSAVDYGIGGDNTANVLWRVENHELDGLKPKVIVLQVGM